MYLTRTDELSQLLSLRKRPTPARQDVLMARKSQERIGELHHLAAVAHAAAAAAHSRGDYSSAVELSKQAWTYSLHASEPQEYAAETLPQIAGVRGRS